MSEPLPQGWDERSLFQLGDYVNGFAFKPEDWSEHGLPIVRIAQITGSSATWDHYPGVLSDIYKLKDGDLIFSWSGTLTVVKWSGGPAWLNQHLFRVDPAPDVAPEFLYHVLRASVAEMDKRAHGSTMKHIKRGELREYWVMVPKSGREQEKIAQILDTLDTQIRQTEALIAKLVRIKQGLLTDLLTRGIDQNGQLRPTPDQAPHLYKDSPLGRIPREWECVSLGDVYAEKSKNGLYKPSAFHGRGYPMVQMGGMFKGYRVDFSSASLIELTAPEIGTFGLEEGDLLFARRSLVLEGAGICCIVEGLNGIATFESSIVRVRLDKARAEPEFVCFFLRSDQAIKDRRKYIRQVAVSGVSGDDIRQFLAVLPPIEEQREVISRHRAVGHQIAIEQERLAKAKLEKAGLMDDLLTGRVRVTPLLDTAEQVHG